MYKIIRYILFGAMMILFFASPWGIEFLAQYSDTFASLNQNFIKKIDQELWILINIILFAVMVFLFSNFG